MAAQKKAATTTGRKKAPRKETTAPLPDVDVFDRVVGILEQARADVVRVVNGHMVIAYWLIGREIVQAVQTGKDRAEYGRHVLDTLSRQLTEKYGRGFSTTNLRYFRTFYTTYSERVPEIRQIGSGELGDSDTGSTATDVLADLSLSVETANHPRGFSPMLGWSHYQALLGVEHRNERLFYEIEAEQEGWNVNHLKRQIHTLLFARLLKSRNKAGMMELIRQGQTLENPADTLKNPYILDFLGIPDSKTFHESELESAIIDNLQQFLLELGKGFAFVSRQKRIQFDANFFYIDLVFYNYILKCFLLIDLKIGELSHQDVGQIDSYVRMFDDKYVNEGDNPTIGLILCTEENETVAKYSVLNDRKQIFASKYMLYLPTEEELRREIERERRLIEERAESATGRTRRRKKG